ncbi:hypothetical protein [Mycobacteroides abscessus]|nr:hypothetical protein [Mycobacteroides abscessus]
MGIPELKVEGLHPDHVEPLERALAEARALLAQAQQQKEDE